MAEARIPWGEDHERVGLPAARELDQAFRLMEKGSTGLSDGRRGKNTQLNKHVPDVVQELVGRAKTP